MIFLEGKKVQKEIQMKEWMYISLTIQLDGKSVGTV